MALPNEEELARLTQKFMDEMATLGKVTPETARAMAEAQTEISNFNFKIEVGTKFLSKMGDAVANTTKAMYNGQKGASAFNQSITDMADAAQIAATGLALLVPGGPIMKAVIAGLTYLGTSALKAGAELTKTANEQSDKLYEAFQKMSTSGAAASDGMSGIFNDLQNLGIGIQDLDGYINLLNESSADLATFRGSVFAGRKAFADVNEQMKPFTEQLYNAGLSQTEINKGAMGYIRLQTQLGQAQSMSTKQLADGAKRYLIEQDALTKLTGTSREQLERQQEAAMMEEAYAAKIRQLQLEGNTEAIEKIRQMNAIYEKAGPTMGRAFRASVTGFYNNADAVALNIASNGELFDTTEQVIAGNMKVTDAVTRVGKQTGDFVDDVGTTLGQLGVYNESFGNIAEQNKLRIMAEQDLTKQLEQIVEDQKKQGIEGGKAKDNLQQVQTDIRILQRDTMLTTQAFVQQAVEPATEAMKKLAIAANAAANALLKTSGQQMATEQRAQSAYSNNEAVGAAGEVGQVAAEGQVSAGAPVQPQKVKSVKEMNWLDKLLVGKKEVARREAAEAAGQTPAQAAGVTAPPTMPGGGAAGPAPTAPGGQGTNKVSSYSDKLVNYIKTIEGFAAKAFWDKKQYTNGYGTKATDANETITVPEAEKRLREQLQNAVQSVVSFGRRYNYDWTQGQVDALTSFVYNAGAGQLENLTAGGKRTKEQIAQALLLYNKARDTQTDKVEEVPGLTKRRQEEQAMYMGARDGGVFDGPKTGYPMTLHGMEAVIPLKDGAVPVTMSQEFSTNVTNMSELVEIMKTNATMQDRMISVLEDIRRSQSSVADNTGRMASLAAN